MIQKIYDNEPLYQIDEVKKDHVADYEYKLQELADILPSSNFDQTRYELAVEQREEDVNNFIKGSSQAIQYGANPEMISSMVQTYIPEDTSNRSLEIAAAENQTSQAFIDDNITYDNAINDDKVDDLTEEQALKYKYAKMDEEFTPKDLSQFGEYALYALGHGVLLDTRLIQKVKNNVKGVEWGDALTWDDMHQAYKKQWEKTFEETGYTGLNQMLDTIGESLSSEADPAVRMQTMRLIEHDVDGDDLFNLTGFTSLALAPLKAAGNVKKAASIAAIGDDIAEKIPSAVKKTSKVDRTINYANSDQVSKSLLQTSNDKEVAALIEKYKQDFRVEPTQMDIDNINTIVHNNYGKDFKADVVDFIDATQDGDTLKATVLFGDGMNKQAAMTKKSAEQLAEKLKLEDYQIVKKDGAGYYIQKQIDIDAPVSELSTAEFGSMGFGRMFYGSSIMPKWFHEEAISGYRKATKMEKDLSDAYGKAVRSLNKKQRRSFEELYLKGQQANHGRGAWFNTNYLLKNGEIDKTTADAYNAFRKVSDIDYLISNDRVWRKLSKIGYVNDDTGDIVKVVKSGVTKTPNYSQMLIKNGDKIITSRTHSAETIEEMLKGGDVLVEIAPITVKGKGLEYTHKIINPSKLSKELNRFVLPYRAGGRRRYEYGTNFLRIGQTMSIGGEQVNAFSKVLGATSDATEANRIKDELNAALELAQRLDEGADSAQIAKSIERANFKNINVSNTEDLRKLTENLDVTQRVQVVKEGESMVYNNGLRTLFEDPLDYDTSFAELAQVKGTFYNKRGNILDNLLGTDARLVNPFDIFNQTVQRASFNNSLGALYEQMGTLFKSKYIDFIDTKRIPNPRTLSGEDLLRYGKLRDLSEVSDINKQSLREAINMQRIYQRLTNTPTETDKYIHRQMGTLAKLFYPKGGKSAQALVQSDPFSFGRAVMFHTTMGCFNLKQLWAQAMGAVNMAFAHPIVFTRALLATPFIIAGNFVPGLKGISKGFATLTGLKPSDFDGILKYMDEMGTTMGTYRLPMSERFKVYRAGEIAGKILKMPVEAGTNFANIVNDIAAYIEAPVKDFKKIASRADDFAMNLTNATQSAFQAGQILPTKSLAQFTSYPFRVMEAMTVHNRLTVQEKLGIALGQITMWGMTGTLLNREDASNVNRWANEKLQGLPENVRQTFLNGIITTFFREAYGLEVSEPIEGAKLISTGNDLLQVILGNEDIQEVELPGAFQVTSRATALMKAALTLGGLRSEGDGPVDIIRYAQNIAMDPNMASGFRNLTKMYIGLTTQRAFNTSGKLIKDNVNFEQAIGMGFGMGLTESRVSSELYNIYNNMQKTIKTDFEDTMLPVMTTIMNSFNLPEEERYRLTNKFNTARAAYIERAHQQYGLAGQKEAVANIKKFFRSPSLAVSNEKYSRQYGNNILEYMTDLFYRR